jgi:uncharacterized peroxidase-related enzyme
VETAPAGSRAALEEIESKYGFIPNLAAVFAESPAALNGLLGALTSFDVAEMSLPPLERQVVLLAASVQNRCAYCTAAHSMLASVQGMDRAEVVRLQQGLPLSDARLEALRNFVEGIVQHRGRLRESDVQRFLAAGFTRAQVLEIIFGVALKTLTNYANHVAMPPVNEQFAEYLPDWPDVA